MMNEAIDFVVKSIEANKLFRWSAAVYPLQGPVSNRSKLS